MSTSLYEKRVIGCRGWPLLVPVTGVEPVRYCYHRILSPTRLPIPSYRRVFNIIAYFDEKSNRFSEKSFGRNSYVALAWWIYKNSIMRGTELLHIALDIFVGMCYNINILAENGL